MNFNYQFRSQNSEFQFNLNQASGSGQPSHIKIGEHFYSIVPKNPQQHGAIKEFLERAIRENNISNLDDLKRHITEVPAPAAAASSARSAKVGLAIINLQQLKIQTVNTIAHEMRDKYVFPDKGQEAADYIQRKLQNGAYDAITDFGGFARTLTEDMYLITKDKHLCVDLKQQQASQPQSAVTENLVDLKEYPLLPHLENIKAYIAPTHVGWMGEPMGCMPFEYKSGFLDKEKTIGYFDLRKFGICEPNSEYAKGVFNKWFPRMADSVRIEDARARCQAIREMIQHLRKAKAIVIDLRWNSGGDPYAVRFLCSFFMPENRLLNRIEWRTPEGIRNEEFFTLPNSELPASERLLTAPPSLYVLTSPDTFSAAEEFSKNMKVNNRGTIVGRVTGGGANPGGWRDINDSFEMFIPTGRAALDNWEGKGIIPHHEVPHEQALDKALELIRKQQRV